MNKILKIIIGIIGMAQMVSGAIVTTNNSTTIYGGTNIFNGVMEINSTVNGVNITNVNAQTLQGLSTNDFQPAGTYLIPSDTNNFVDASITNGLGGGDTSWYSRTNDWNTATNKLDNSVTNGFTSIVYSNSADFQPVGTYLIPSDTNGFVDASITNGLGGGSDPSITNSLASTNYVNNEVAKYIPTSSLPALTNGFIKIADIPSQTNNFTSIVYSNPSVFQVAGTYLIPSDTNRFASTNYVNSEVAKYIPTSSLPNLTNTFVTASITNGLGGGITNVIVNNSTGTVVNSMAIINTKKVPILYLSGVTSANISADTITKLAFASSSIDTLSGWSAANNWYDFNTSYPGYYLVSFTCRYNKGTGCRVASHFTVASPTVTNTQSSVVMANNGTGFEIDAVITKVISYTGGVSRIWFNGLSYSQTNTVAAGFASIVYVSPLN